MESFCNLPTHKKAECICALALKDEALSLHFDDIKARHILCARMDLKSLSSVSLYGIITEMQWACFLVVRVLILNILNCIFILFSAIEK